MAYTRCPCMARRALGARHSDVVPSTNKQCGHANNHLMLALDLTRSSILTRAHASQTDTPEILPSGCLETECMVEAKPGLLTYVEPQLDALFYMDHSYMVTRQCMHYVGSVWKDVADGDWIQPLIIIGPPKSGKTATAKEIVPAVIHCSHKLGRLAAAVPAPAAGAVSSDRGDVTGQVGLQHVTQQVIQQLRVWGITAPPLQRYHIWHVNCTEMEQTKGVDGFFQSLFMSLRASAKEAGCEAAGKYQPTDASWWYEVKTLLELLPGDCIHYIIMDEADRFFLLYLVDQKTQHPSRLDISQVYRMQTLFKVLIMERPVNVSFIITSATGLWANIQLAPIDGEVLAWAFRRLHLDSTTPAAELDAIWDELTAHYSSKCSVNIPKSLRAACPPQKAMAAFACQQWVAKAKRHQVEDSHKPEDVTAFVTELITTSYVAQMLNDVPPLAGVAVEMPGGLEALLAAVDPAGSNPKDDPQFPGIPQVPAAKPWGLFPIYTTLFAMMVNPQTGQLKQGFSKERAAASYLLLQTYAQLGVGWADETMQASWDKKHEQPRRFFELLAEQHLGLECEAGWPNHNADSAASKEYAAAAGSAALQQQVATQAQRLREQAQQIAAEPWFVDLKEDSRNTDLSRSFDKLVAASDSNLQPYMVMGYACAFLRNVCANAISEPWPEVVLASLPPVFQKNLDSGGAYEPLLAMRQALAKVAADTCRHSKLSNRRGRR